jgi:hypothetical protein
MQTSTESKRARKGPLLAARAPIAARITASPNDVNQKAEIEALVEAEFARIKDYADLRDLDDPRRLPTLGSSLFHYLKQFATAVLGASQGYTGGLVNYSGALFSYLDSYETAGRVRFPYTLSSGGAGVEGERISGAAIDVLFTGRGVPTLFTHVPGILVGFARNGQLRLQPIPQSWLEPSQSSLLCELLEASGLALTDDPALRNRLGHFLNSVTPIWR